MNRRQFLETCMVSTFLGTFWGRAFSFPNDCQESIVPDLPATLIVVDRSNRIAVALHYDGKTTVGAPIVLAKGNGPTAGEIVNRWARFQVPVLENEPLAQCLLENGEVGSEIPVDLYNGVAEMLARVYRMKARAG